MDRDLFKRLLLLGTDPKGKGGMATVMNFYRQLAGDNFRFICVHRFEPRLWQFFRAIAALFRLLYALLFSPIRLVHIQTASYTSFYRDSFYLLVAKLLRKKVVLHLHGGEFELFYRQTPRYCQFICRQADCLVGVSQYFVQVFEQFSLNSHIVCLYNPVPLPRLDLSEDKYEDKDLLHVSFLGTINETKGVFEILDCWQRYRSYFEGRVRLNLAGIGEEDRLRAQILEHNLQDLITYHAWVDADAKAKLLNDTDIYLQPSHFESLGIAIIEAMSYGIPVVASRVGGIPELIKDQENGLLISPSCVEELFSAIAYLVERPQERARMGLSGLQRAQRFGTETIENAIKKLYIDLLHHNTSK